MAERRDQEEGGRARHERPLRLVDAADRHGLRARVRASPRRCGGQEGRLQGLGDGAEVFRGRGRRSGSPAQVRSQGQPVAAGAGPRDVLGDPTDMARALLRWLLVAAFLSCAAAPCSAQFFPSNLFDPSVISAGMGGASAAVAWSAEPNYWANPALLGYYQGIRW